ncbi:MAG: alpha/beta hydrolase [Caulobacteraceae bacterium]
MGPPAPLLSLPEAPAPEGVAAEWFTGAGGLQLRATLIPATSPRGSVVINPGRGEPIEKYFEVAGELVSRGFSVLIHDWRGHGLSARMHRDRLKGHSSGAAPMLEDFECMMAAFGPRLPKPWVMLGHSMGGMLTVLALLADPTRFAGAAITAPMMGILVHGVSRKLLRRQAGIIRLIGLGGLYVLARTDPVSIPFERNVLTHDEARWRRYRAQLEAWPDLRVGGVTWGWLDFALQATTRMAVDPRVPGLGANLTVFTAEEERVVENDATLAFATRAGARLVEVKGALHEILMETDERRAVFWAEFDRLADRVAPKPA